MAKTSMVERDKQRRQLVARKKERRAELNALIHDKTTAIEDRFAAMLQLARMPRDSSKVRIRNRCRLTGRPRGCYRKFALSRIALRDLASDGLIPGVIKSSW